MSWSEQVFRYCERGLNAAFWAEPLNAVTNAAFLAAAVAGYLHYRRRTAEGEAACSHATIMGFTALVIVIAIGSFLFHTLATRWSGFADTLPIGIFMLTYSAFAFRRLLGLNLLWTVIGWVGFVAMLVVAGRIRCGNAECFNGSLGYAPALVLMLVIGAVMVARGARAGKLVLAAGLVFIVSLTARTLDLQLCAHTLLAGRPFGLHALWHILNATTLYLLLRAAVEGGGGVRRAG